MNRYFWKVLQIFLVFTSPWFGNLQGLNAQSSSLHDSLRHFLIYFREQTKDEKIKEVIRVTEALYFNNNVDDSLAKKLLTVEDLLLGTSLNQQMILSYAETLVRVLNHLPPLEQHPAYAKSLYYLARLYRSTGKYDNALPVLKQALALTREVQKETHPDYGTCLNEMANLFFYRGLYDSSILLYEQACAIRRNVLGEKDPDYATSLNSLGYLYLTKGRNEEALSLFQKAAEIRKKPKGQEDADYANSLTSIALLYYRMEQYDKALPLFQQTVTILKKELGEEHREYAAGLNNLALLYEKIGEYDRALHCYQKALPVFKTALSENHPFYAALLNNLGLLYFKMGDYENALHFYKRELSITKELLGEQHQNCAISLNNLADVYVNMGLYDTALLYYQQASNIVKKKLDEEHRCNCLNLTDLAHLYQTMGHFDTALNLYTKALAICQKVYGNEHPGIVDCLTGLGLLYTVLDHQSQAASLFITKASAIKLKQLTQTYAVLSEQEKMIFLNKEAYQFSYPPSLLFTGGANHPALLKNTYTNELVLKGMVLEDQQGVLYSIRKSGDSVALKFYDQWRKNKAFLGKQLLLPSKEQVPYLDSLEEATNELEQQLSRHSTAFRTQLESQNITVKDIAQKLTTGQAAVEFIRFSLYNKKPTDSILYAALVLLPQDTIPHFVALFEEKQLQHLLRLFTGSGLTDQSVVVLGKLSDSLYTLVWKPLESYLQGIHTLYYAPTGLLHRIAFQALRADATHLLIDKYQLNQVLSTRSVALPVAMAQKPRMAAVWGGIEYSITKSIASHQGTSWGQISEDSLSPSAFALYNEDNRGQRGGAFDPLPYSKEETDSVTNLLLKAGIRVTSSSGASATEEAFKSLEGNVPQVVHLATHGFFLPEAQSKRIKFEVLGGAYIVQQNPLFRSGLVLAGGNYVWEGGRTIPDKEDGILTAYELAQMDLSNVDLMVLSACGTALGDLEGNEGVIGLQRALKMAGVKQLLISLWDVNDKTTMELMTLFYRNWLSGQTTREALRKAQLKMKEKYPSPYYWAAFVLVE